ncbi:MAG TPA: PAS domain-containing protein [Xanthobacteraceae bacterium]|nr:PAS domain-containing protein [Xanthobacteraceae bacterium]
MDGVFAWLAQIGNAIPAEAAFWRQTPSKAALAIATWAAALTYFLIPAGIIWAAWRRPDLPLLTRFLAAALFLLSFVFAVWQLSLPMGRAFQFSTPDALAATSVVAGLIWMILLWMLFSRVVSVPGAASLIADRKAAEKELLQERARAEEAVRLRAQLENTLVEKTGELAQVSSRLDTCLRGAKVYLFSQDRDLRYVGVFGPRGEDASTQMLGRSDDEILVAPERDAITAIKRKVIESGNTSEIEAWYDMPEGRVLFSLHIEAMRDVDGNVTGLRCAAADITRIRLLEAEQRRLAEELRNALHRYEIALRGSNVTVFTQDPDLRYTSISNSFLGRRVDQIVGLTDAEVVPPQDRDAVIELKQRALSGGEPVDAELRLKGLSATRWFDFHVEPLRDAEGKVAGLTCAAVDITERKAGEDHLRLLMRELTHRSKNLLAVIQALARQTSRHAGSIESFLDEFSARLQALSRSHDLLVQEEWHSVSLRDLARSQLGHYLDSEQPRIGVEGPNVHLKPEAAQGLGLALHELAVNAAKYGALSNPAGRVDLSWDRDPEGDGIVIRWLERGGPKVEHPKKHGFGTLAIQRNLSRALEADVDLNFAEEGVSCTITVPAQHLFMPAAAPAET